MAQTAQLRSKKRPPRVKLLGTVLVFVELENGRKIRARLHQLSVSGGLLHLDNPLDEGIKVHIRFNVGSSTIRGKASVLFPIWATKGCLQPFEFLDLAQEDRNNLESDIKKLLELSSDKVRIVVEDVPKEAAIENGLLMEGNPPVEENLSEEESPVEEKEDTPPDPEQ